MLHDDLTGFSPDIPPDFNPHAQPILAEHWFGIEVETSAHTVDEDALDLDREAA